MKTPRKHRHAELMKQWLEDDSLEVEWLTPEGDWETEPEFDWDEGMEYRIKPKMIKCGDMEFPEPMRVAPEIGTPYWVADMARLSFLSNCYWSNDCMDTMWLERGICHDNQAAAEAHTRALIALTDVKDAK